MSIVVQKYGGTSVSSGEKIMNVARRVAQIKARGDKPVVVLSAMGDTTDELLELADQVTAKPPERELAQLLATGEQVSIALLTMALDSLGVKAISFTGWQAGIKTRGNHVNSTILEIDDAKIHGVLDTGKVAVIAGFQGINADGEITTLGRGGSDTTAVALAAALKAETCEIYTDVDGVYTVDPRLVKRATKLDKISYDEMLEMATLGAQVLHPRAVECAKEYGVNLYVRSSFSNDTGTLVTEEDKMEKGVVIRGIACDRDQTKFAILSVPDRPGIAYKIFNAIAEAGINVDLIVQSVHKNGVNDILFTVSRKEAARVKEILDPVSREIGASKVISQERVAKISVVGAGMALNPGVAAGMFKALAGRGINIEIISTSEIRISCLIAEDRLQEAAEALHEHFKLG